MSSNSRSTIIFIIGLIGVAVVLGYNYFFQPFAQLNWQPSQLLPAPASPAPSTVTTVWEQFSTKQKVAQLIAQPVVVDNSLLPGLISGQRVGVVTLFGSSISTQSARVMYETLSASTSGIGSAWWQKPLLAIDHEGGSVQRLSGVGFTPLPAWQQLCNASPEVRRPLLQQSAKELAQTGIDVIWAPMADLGLRHPALKDRLCSNDPTVTVERVQEFIRIFDQAGVMPVVKHFPGIGSTKTDLHTQFDRVTVTPADAAVYRRLFDEFGHSMVGVMVSHAGVINQYPDVPCSLSQACISEFASRYPEVLVVSDALDMASARYVPSNASSNASASISANTKSQVSGSMSQSLPRVTQTAIRSGINVLVFGPSVTAQDLEQVMTELTDQYISDPDFARRVDVSGQKILQLKYERRQGKVSPR